MGRTGRLLLFSLLAATVLPGAAAGTLDIPHRRGHLTIDGDLADWPREALVVDLVERELGAPLANAGTFRLVWDRDHLWLVAEIRDDEVYAAPTAASGSSLYQWDSVELYVDGRGDRADRMDADDFQIIVACDGRTAVLQGDPLLRTVEQWQVPKRVQAGVVVKAATRRTAEGYVVEAAVPLEAIGVEGARDGRVVAIDLAWNDWTENHPRLPELLKDLENLAQLMESKNEAAAALVDPDSLGWQGLQAWEDRAYRPWSWRSGRDFGRPQAWQAVRLCGAPTFLERLDDRWGTGNILLYAFGLTLAAALAVDLRLRRRYRRRVRALMARVAAIEVVAAAAPEPPPARVPDAAPPASPLPVPEPTPADLITRVDSRGGAGAVVADLPPAPGDVVGRLLAHVRAHLDEPLGVTGVAADLGVSARTLQRACRDELAASPHDVILAVKMARARDLLSGGGWRVSEVAEQLGFDSPYHFSRRFKELVGQPPSSLLPGRREQI